MAARVRKSVFLREAIRLLGLERAEVANVRFEQMLSEPRFREAASWVSVRAVRADLDLWRGLSAFLAPNGRVLWFRSTGVGVGSLEAGHGEAFELKGGPTVDPRAE